MPSTHGPRVVAHLGSSRHPKSKLHQVVNDHHLNHCVAVTVPTRSADASWFQISAITEASFQVLELPLSALLDMHRAALAGRSPAQIALASLGRRIDRDGACSSSYNGYLLIDVTEEMFQTLGLQGQRIAKQAGETATSGATQRSRVPSRTAHNNTTINIRRHSALSHLPPHIFTDVPAWQRPA